MNKFINNKIEPINLNGQLSSICFFGINKKSFVKVYKKTFIEKTIYNIISFDDERYHFGPQAEQLNEKIFNYYKNLKIKA